MILEAYTAIAILCGRNHDCERRTIWHGADRDTCMVKAFLARVNPPYPYDYTKMAACIVDRERPNYEWATEGYWRKIRD